MCSPAPEWTRKTSVTTPAARYGASFVFDTQRSKAVLFGGSSANNLLSDLWEWNGTVWVAPQTALRPPERVAAAAAYDPVRQRMVVFGGSAPFGPISDLWEWDGTTWTTQVISPRPPARSAASLVFDPRQAKLILFGGLDVAGTSLGDTWELDSNGNTWTQVIGPGPSARSSHQMVYDPVRQKVILFGGNDPTGTLLNDTWELTPSGWLNITPTSGTIIGTGNAASAWDGQAEVVAIVGGNTMAGYTTAGWEYDGTWRPMAAPFPTPARIGSSMVYDSIRHRLVLFGGTDGTNPMAETWER